MSSPTDAERRYLPVRHAEPVDLRDYPARAHLAATDGLPSSALVHNPFPVRDQGYLGSCVGFAVSSLLQVAYLKRVGGCATISPLAVYYAGRVLDGTVPYDAGTFVRSALKGARTWGTAWEDDHPYSPTFLTLEPDFKARFDAMFWRPLVYARIAERDLDGIRASVASGAGCALIFAMQQGVFSANWNGGVIPPYVPGEQEIGAHCVHVIGYDDSTQLLRVRNSWGDTGDHGDFYLPYNFVTLGATWDAWTAS